MVKFTFQDLRIQEVSRSSGVFTGRNLQIRWKSSQKINDGFGSISGDRNRIVRNATAVRDHTK